MAHHATCQARPRPVRARRPRHLADGEAIDACADDRQQGRQQRQRGRDREPDDDRPGDPDRAQDHEFEEDEPEQTQQDRQPAEEDRPAGGRHRHPDGVGDPVRPVRPQRQLLAEPARHQQRVVDPEPETQQRRQVEHEDAHRHDRGDDEDAAQRHDDRRSTDDQRDARGHQRTEDEDQGERRQGQRDDLAPAQVRFGDGLDVAVEGGPAGQLDVEPGRRPQALAQDRQRIGRIVRRQVEEDDVVGGVAVARRSGAATGGARRRGRRAGAVPTSRIASAAATSNAGVPASSVGLEKTTTSADGGAPSSVSRSALARADSRSSRMNPPALSWPGTCGANGSAISSRAAHAPTTHHARCTTKRPSRSKGVTSGFRLGLDDG